MGRQIQFQLSFLLMSAILSKCEMMPTAFAFSIGNSASPHSIVTTRLTPASRRRRSRHHYNLSRITPSKVESISSVLGATSAATEEKEILVEDFVSRVSASIQDDTFVSLTLRGKKKSKQQDANQLRGSIRQVQGRLIQLKPKRQQNKNGNIDDSKFLQLTVKYHGATDICKNLSLKGAAVCNDGMTASEYLKQLILRPSITLQSEWGVNEKQDALRSAELQTVTHNHHLVHLVGKNDSPKLTATKVSRKESSPSINLLNHDRQKNVPLDVQKSASFWQALGLVQADGRTPRPGKSSKLRQCQKFVEIVAGMIPTSSGSETLSSISVLDMGCGRGYLTFSLHSYLKQHYENVISRGIDVRPKLMKEMNDIVASLNGSGDNTFQSLSFHEGTIEQMLESSSTTKSQDTVEQFSPSLDILIALHACDTATDDALWTGIQRQADLLIVAPCCQKELRPQLDEHAKIVTKNDGTHPMQDVWRYGIYRERLAETVTDSLRALLLERAGYKVQIFEFIGGEHTSKNVMITAAKTKLGQPTGKQLADLDGRIQELASFHGVHSHQLARWMNFDMIGDRARNRNGTNVLPAGGSIGGGARKMPPRRLQF